MRVATLYDRLLGMSLGLTGMTSPDRQLDRNTRDSLRTWVRAALELQQLLKTTHVGLDSSQFVRRAVERTCGNRNLETHERSIAIALGIFYWCDRDEVYATWRETLSLHLGAEERQGVHLFSEILRSFLREPSGRTIWLPLKRKTTIAALQAFPPQVCAELQSAELALLRNREMYRTATAIACQLPWYSSACRLANRHADAQEMHCLIGALLGAAFGTIAFQEQRRAVRPIDRCGPVAHELAPLWQAWTGSHFTNVAVGTVPLPLDRA